MTDRADYHKQLVFNETVRDGLRVHLSGDGSVLIGGIDCDDTATLTIADVPALRACLDRLLIAANVTEERSSPTVQEAFEDLMRDAPLASFAPATGGGGWLRVSSGWLWNGHTTSPGSLFPVPGADWTGEILRRAPALVIGGRDAARGSTSENGSSSSKFTRRAVI